MSFILLSGWEMTNLRKILASNMKIYRKKLGFSQADLAEKAKVTGNHIALIETCRRFPSIEVLERIAESLQKDTLDLFSLSHNEPEKKGILKTKILTDIEAILTARLNETES